MYLFEKRVKNGMTAFDFGTNFWEMTLHLASLVGKTGAVHAFEPYSPAFGRLVTHVARHQLRDRIQPHATALSNSLGQLTMNVPAAGAGDGGVAGGSAGGGEDESGSAESRRITGISHAQDSARRACRADYAFSGSNRLCSHQHSLHSEP